MSDDDRSELGLSECLAGITAEPPTDQREAPTPVVYNELEYAWEFFNKVLFDGKLPPAIITLSRANASPGWFNKERFANDAGEQIGEITLNPTWFGARSIRANLAEIVHQMVHQAQLAGGKPGREKYHNREFARLCDQIGLVTTADGTPTGTPTGQSVTHIIIEGEAFAKAAQALLTDAFRMTWLDRYPSVEPDEADMRVLTRQALEYERGRAASEGSTASKQDAGAATPLTTIKSSALPAAPDTGDDEHAEEPGGARSLHGHDADDDASDGDERRRLDLGEGDASTVSDQPLMLRTTAMQNAMSSIEKAKPDKRKLKYQCSGACKKSFWGTRGIEVTCDNDGTPYVQQEPNGPPKAPATPGAPRDPDTEIF